MYRRQPQSRDMMISTPTKRYILVGLRAPVPPHPASAPIILAESDDIADVRSVFHANVRSVPFTGVVFDRLEGTLRNEHNSFIAYMVIAETAMVTTWIVVMGAFMLLDIALFYLPFMVWACLWSCLYAGDKINAAFAVEGRLRAAINFAVSFQISTPVQVEEATQALL
eukprot:TRINITY_DN31520_c0_g1_i1.p1 TRINITY_DN31520_c0_g1~~TRINITY_DN31520_c0_g1_i1.p1  ORF type:complete len:168 (+),score=12.06 TRINITY_DN31520_c0_g1_i1:87-590(+)